MDSDSLRVTRDAEGNIKPIEGVSPTLGIKVKVIPLTYGQSRSYDSFGEAMIDWPTEDKLRLLQECLVEPNEFKSVTAEELEADFDAWTIVDLVQAIGLYSGLNRLFSEPDEPVVGKEETPEEVEA